MSLPLKLKQARSAIAWKAAKIRHRRHIEATAA
jgi:hypothetical protein